MGLLTLCRAVCAGGFEFAVAFVKDDLFPPFEFVLGCHVADGRVQPAAVVVLDVSGDEPPRIVERQRGPGPDAFAFERLVPPFDLPVARNRPVKGIFPFSCPR